MMSEETTLLAVSAYRDLEERAEEIEELSDEWQGIR